MNRDIFITQLQSARDLEDKFILSFDVFLQKHVSDNYHLTDAEREFVDKRVQILLADSKRHLNLFTTMLGEVEQHQDMVL
ncbi:MAG: hypothetical protein ACYC48_02120 [Minisyncoccota bacterium]